MVGQSTSNTAILLLDHLSSIHPSITMSSQLGPGLLVVFAQTGDKCTEQEFNEWYDDEHIPLRTSTLETFHSAARYQAVPLDGSSVTPNPKFVAVYTISDNIIFQQERYTKLRANRSEREAGVVQRLERLDRRIYKQTSTPSVNPTPTESNAPFVIFDSFTSNTSSSELQALLESVEGRYSKVPGFKRIRQFEAEDVVVSGLGTTPEDKKKIPTTLLYIEFTAEPSSVLSSTEYQSLTSWFDEALKPFLVEGMRETRAFHLFREYEPTAAIKDVAGK